MNIIEVRADEKTLLHAVTAVHMETFPGFFLTFMGKGFLQKMYLSYCEYGEAALLAAVEDGRVLGFLAYACDMSGLYKYMIKHHLFAFARYSAGAFFRKPSVFMRLLRAFLKPSETKREEAYVELASIGTAPAAKQRGIGTALIDALKARVDFARYAYITLETDAVDNEAANRFYQKNGFTLARTYETHEGRKMNEYRYRKGDA